MDAGPKEQYVSSHGWAVPNDCERSTSLRETLELKNAKIPKKGYKCPESIPTTYQLLAQLQTRSILRTKYASLCAPGRSPSTTYYPASVSDAVFPVHLEIWYG